MIDFRNSIIKKNIHENKNPHEIVDIDNKQQKGKGIKILTPKQMLQILPLAFAQVKPGNTYENLLNEIRQIIYSLYQEKGIAKKVYNNIMNSIKLRNRVNIIFMDFKNSKPSDPHRLLLNLLDKINLRKKW